MTFSQGVVSGTPTASGTYNSRIQATGGVGVVTINPPMKITTVSPLVAGTTGAAYSQTFAASGGNAQVTWTVSSGAPPAGLDLSAAGVLSGTPTTVGTTTFTVRASDAVATTATAQFSLSIAPGVSITTTSLPGGNVGLKLRALTDGCGASFPISGRSCPARYRPE